MGDSKSIKNEMGQNVWHRTRREGVAAEHLSNSERGMQHQFLCKSFKFTSCAVFAQPLDVGKGREEEVGGII